MFESIKTSHFVKCNKIFLKTLRAVLSVIKPLDKKIHLTYKTQLWKKKHW